MTFFRNGYLLVIFVYLISCRGPYHGKDIFGADEFVLDSYKIREGKFSILELEGNEPEELASSLLDEYSDLLCDGDILQIALFHPKRSDITVALETIGKSVGFQVTDGLVVLPDLGSIEVGGLTMSEARKKIEALYNEQIPDSEVFMTYKDRIERKVELAGLVEITSIPVDGKIRLFDVLSKAKIPVEANLFKSYVIRSGKLLPVDLTKLLKEGDMSQNIVMRGGDKIYIAEPEAASLMVMGEVGCERMLSLPSGYISLRSALAACGGIPFTGDKSYIQIIRGSISKPKIYTLSWSHVIHLPNDSLLLMPGDIVYVAPKPITEWNRFISQLVPSFGGLEKVGQGCSSWGIIAP
jgi:polysaccharide biosynthesis/export protein